MERHLQGNLRVAKPEKLIMPEHSFVWAKVGLYSYLKHTREPHPYRAMPNVVKNSQTKLPKFVKSNKNQNRRLHY